MANKTSKEGWDLVALIVAGIGLGWLMGQSLSPVLMTVVTGLVAVVGGLISALSGLNKEEPQDAPARTRHLPRASALPLGAFVVGLAVGAPAGIWVRTHKWFASPAQNKVEEWSSLGIPREEVARRLFEQQFPATVPERFRQWVGKDPQALVNQWSALEGIPKKKVAQALFRLQFPENAEALTAPPTPDRSPIEDGVLMNTLGPDECKRLQNASDAELPIRLASSTKEIRTLASELKPESLRMFVEVICGE